MIHGRTHYGREFDVAEQTHVEGNLWVGAYGPFPGSVLDLREDFPDSIERAVPEARHVLDVEEEFGIPWFSMSAPIAVEVAHAMGCTSLVMYGQDAWTSGGKDTRRWMPDGRFEDDPHAAYYLAGKQAQDRADAHGMATRWGTGVTA